MVSVRAVAAFACFIACLFVSGYADFKAEEHTPVQLAPHVVNLINNGNHGWKATTYPKFEGMTMAQARKFLGATGRRNVGSGSCTITPSSNIPDSFDSRQQWSNCIHPIRNQEQCGSCWAFAASEVLSDRYCIATNGQVNVVLSPQDLVACDKGDYGCDGGYLDVSWGYLESTGIVSDACFPYTAGNGIEGKCLVANGECAASGVTYQKYKAQSGSSCTATSVAQIQTMISTHGPVEAAFSVYQDFFSYSSGVYSHKYGSLAGGHAIKVVGWGVDSASKSPYWIVANSWGEDWGEQGFFRILRGSNECGIESQMIAGLPAV